MMRNGVRNLVSIAWLGTWAIALPVSAQEATTAEAADGVVEDGPSEAAPSEGDPTEANDEQVASDLPKAAAVSAEPASPTAYDLTLRSIEERVNQLKEKIYQSKSRLIQLQEVVLHGTISGAKAVLLHRNEMGGSFRLTRVQYSLDGAPIFNRVDKIDGELADLEEIEVFAGSIAPGNHQISVYLEYQGYGYGVFNYLNGYTFRLKSSYTFNAEEGKLTNVKIVGFEKGGITTELQDRPSVRYDVEASRELQAGSQAEGGAKK